MSVDRSVRSLSALGTASSSRVLNLAAIALAQADNPLHAAQPFFVSAAFNNAIFVKHRLRADEAYLFPESRAVATKIIIPFEKSDLRVGGRSFFFGERGYIDAFREAGNHTSPTDMKRDLDVLTLLDAVPSLDPFLLREFLRNHDFAPDACYFDISPADQTKMYTHAAAEVRRLTSMAIKGSGTAYMTSTAKMISALLSSEVGEKLEPLRATLRLGHDEFREGVFSWRGFLFYKWSMAELKPQVMKVLRDLNTIRVHGRADSDALTFLGGAKRSIAVAVRSNLDEVARVLAIYDTAYARLIEHEDPMAFRTFLLEAPPLFLEMGEKMGAMSHIASFWRYRFPAGAPRTADAEELSTIFNDFLSSVGAACARHAN
ncbi:MAG TPA: hypothetical protein VG889_12780 [Rhizomicrobium sp.]|nr:hypothetical protein [Rhizomicrobium sp.]